VGFEYSENLRLRGSGGADLYIDTDDGEDRWWFSPKYIFLDLDNPRDPVEIEGLVLAVILKTSN
jgi:hypothetical protein